MKKHKKIISFILEFLIVLIIMIGIITLAINLYMVNYSKKYILDENNIDGYNFDAIVVLGASVRSNGEPSPMLQDRLDESIVLYNLGISNRILMSGDHSTDDYDEVTTMKNYAINKGIPSENVFVDHLGINTFSSMKRLQTIYSLNNAVIVTQDYHLYRSIYIARKLGVEVYGVSSTPRIYDGQIKRDIREVLARVKDFFQVMFTKEVKKNSVVSIYESGNITNEK